MMFNNSGFTFKGSTLLLMMASFALAFAQLATISWCNASSPYFGYFYDADNQLHSCVFNVPGDLIFTYGSLLLNILGMANLYYDFSQTRDRWRDTKSVNISRIVFTISFVSVNSLLEVLTHAYAPPKAFTPYGMFYYNMGWLLPLCIVLMIVSAWSIINKVELHFNLPRKR